MRFKDKNSAAAKVCEETMKKKDAQIRDLTKKHRELEGKCAKMQTDFDKKIEDIRKKADQEVRKILYEKNQEIQRLITI